MSETAAVAAHSLVEKSTVDDTVSSISPETAEGLIASRECSPERFESSRVADSAEQSRESEGKSALVDDVKESAEKLSPAASYATKVRLPRSFEDEKKTASSSGESEAQSHTSFWSSEDGSQDGVRLRAVSEESTMRPTDDSEAHAIDIERGSSTCKAPSPPLTSLRAKVCRSFDSVVAARQFRNPVSELSPSPSPPHTTRTPPLDSNATPSAVANLSSLPTSSSKRQYNRKRLDVAGSDKGDNRVKGADPRKSPKVRGIRPSDKAPSHSPKLHSNTTGPKLLSLEDFDTLQRLDQEYERALEEKEVGWNARYNSVRQSAGFSLGFMLLYLVIGTLFFNSQMDWPLSESLLFSIYTITTVGYGTTDFPHTDGVLIFTIFYIFVGIATLIIMVAQVYQYLSLEATRAQFERDVADIKHRGFENNGGDLESVVGTGDGNGSGLGLFTFDDNPWANRSARDACMDCAVKFFGWAKLFFRHNHVGQVMAVMFPFLGLILLGAVVVGSIEGWTFVQAVYFSVVSLTTVGFGDYVPTRPASVWFCIFWLPSSVGFMSLYLGSVAHFYIQLSNRNINRLERRMRRYIRRAKEAKEKEREAAFGRAMAAAGQSPLTPIGTDDLIATAAPQDSKPRTATSRTRRTLSNGFATLPTTADSSDADTDEANPGPLFGSREAAHENFGEKRRQRVLLNSGVSLSESDVDDLRERSRPRGETIITTKDLLLAVKKGMQAEKASRRSKSVSDQGPSLFSDLRTDDIEFMSLRFEESNHLGGRTQKKPSFALRMLVQERMAEIIATEIAGYQSQVEIKENTLSVTIHTLKYTADKWMVPRRARKAFRAVAFEVLYFVGEHGLITRGADALYDLTPFEFHGLFGPLLAAMGDSDTMEGWLAVTKLLADVDLRRDSTRPKGRVLSSAQPSRSMVTAALKSADKPASWDERHVNNRRTAKEVEIIENDEVSQVKEANNVDKNHDYTWPVAGTLFANGD